MNNDKTVLEEENEYWQPSLLKTILVSIFFSPFVYLYLGRVKAFLVTIGLIMLFIPVVAKITVNYENGLTVLAICFTAFTLVLALNFRNRKSLRKQPWFSKWWGISISVLLFFSVLFSIRIFLIDIYKVPASSMEPNIPKGSVIFVRKWNFPAVDLFGFGFPSNSEKKNLDLGRGNVYVYIHPLKMQIYIHRLAALAGDNIDINESGLTINKSYISRALVTQEANCKTFVEKFESNKFKILECDRIGPGSYGQWKVPDQHIFFLGDNRQRSADSRYIGYIPIANLAGELLLVW